MPWLREPDENAAAHFWQLLMAAQSPIMAVLTVRWLPQVLKQALPILALQVAALVLTPEILEYVARGTEATHASLYGY